MTRETNASDPPSPAKSPPHRRARRWIRRIVIGLPAIALGVVVVAVVALHTDWGREQVRRQAVTALSELFPGGIEVEQLEGSVFGTLTIRGVTVYDLRHRRAITLQRGSVNLGLTAILRHTIEVERLDLEGLTVRAFHDGDALNLATLIRIDPDKPPSTWRVHLEEVRLSRGALALTRPSAGARDGVTSDHFDDIALRGSATIDPLGPVAASLTAGLRWRERALPAELRARGKVTDGVVELQHAEASLGGLRAAIRDLRFASPSDVAGTIELRAAEGSLRSVVPALTTSPAIALTAAVKSQSAELMQVKLDASVGEATLSGTLAVAPLVARPHATGELQLRNIEPAAVVGPRVLPELTRARLIRASIAFDAAATGMSFSLGSLAGSVRGTAEIGYGPKTHVPITLDTRLKDRRLVATATGSAGTSQLRATADVTFDEQGPLQIHKAMLRAHLAASDVPAQLRAAHQIAGVVDIDLSARGAIDLNTLTAVPDPVPATSVAKPPSPADATTATAKRLPELTITGSVDGTGLRFADYAADHLHLALAPAVLAAWPRGSVVARLTGGSAAGQTIPDLEVRADSAATGTVDVAVALTPSRNKGDPSSEISQVPRAGQRVVAASPSPAHAAPTQRGTSPEPVSLLAAFGAEGALDLNATVRLDRGYRGAAITLRNLRGAFRGLEVKANESQIVLRPGRQEVRRLRLASSAGTIAVDGVRAGKNITANIAIDQLELSRLGAVAPQFAKLEGRVQLRASGSLRGRKVEGTLRGEVAQLVARPGAAPVDANIVASANPQLLQLAVRAGNRTIGEILVDADIAPPKDPLSPSAWRALDRRSVRRVRIQSPRIDLGAVYRATGTATGTPTSTPTGTPAVHSESLTSTGASQGAAEEDLLAALHGNAAIDFELSPTGGSLRASFADLILPGIPLAMAVTVGGEVNADGDGNLAASARMADITVEATAAFSLPTRPFRSESWASIAERMPHATLEVPRFVVTHSLASKLGLGTWRGQASASLDLDLGSATAHGRIALLDIRGGPLQRPVELVAEVTASTGGIRVVGQGTLDGTPAMQITVEAPPLSIVGGARSGGTTTRWADLPLKGELRFGPLPAATVARALGARATVDSRLPTSSAEARDNAADARNATPPPVGSTQAGATGASQRGRLSGTIRGQMSLAGTLRSPDFTIGLEIDDLGSRRAKIRELRFAGRYAAGAMHAELTGSGDKAGRLHGRIDLDPKIPAESRIHLSATGFDLSPLARLAPAALLGVTAQLDGAINVKGLEPKQMQIAGNLTLSKIRLPIANQVGTLTDATLRLAFNAGRLTANLQGSIESGKIVAAISAALDGIVPRSATLDVALSDLSLITALTPTVGGKLHVEARVANDRWKLDARITDGMVRIPAEEGRVLHRVSPPADLVFVSNARQVKEPPRNLAQSARSWAASRATSPWLEIALAIDAITLRTDEATGIVRGNVDVGIADSGLSTDGIIRLTGGEVLLFGRRYQISRAAVAFDGSIDPTVDAELRHDFSQLTLMATVSGRASKPQFHFRSSPPDYTEAQLLGFFLGGTPSSSGRDTEAANSVAAAIASQTLGTMITRRLPVRLDVLSYQPQTTSSSGALVAGRWITEQLLLLVRNRTNPRPLENGAEGELQYWLRRGLLLDGVAGDRGTFGLDLLWNRRW